MAKARLRKSKSPDCRNRGGRNNGAKGVQNEGLIQSIVRAHAWKRALLDGAHDSVEMLAEANQLHPKVVRQALRLAFLSPQVISAILEGRQPKGLR
jgi:site-specific DNA recombinase